MKNIFIACHCRWCGNVFCFYGRVMGTGGGRSSFDSCIWKGYSHGRGWGAGTQGGSQLRKKKKRKGEKRKDQ